MRKILLSTTALVALGVASAQAADFTISGGSEFDYTSWSDKTTDTGGANNNDMTFVTNITISASQTTDSGLTLSGVLLQDDGAAKDNDARSVSISGDFGKITMGGNTAADAFDIDGETANESGGGRTAVAGAASGIGVGMGGEEEGLAYYSPSINGFTFGASMHNAGSASKADGTTYGVKYSTDAAGGTVSIAWAAASRGNTGAETAGSETGYDTTHIGGSIAVGAATIELAQYNQKENGTTATFNDDYSRNSYGLSYKASDTITLNVHSQSGDNSKVTNYDWEETAYDITYAIAPGLTMTMSYTDYNETAADGTACTGTCDGTATNMAIDLSF